MLSHVKPGLLAYFPVIAENTPGTTEVAFGVSGGVVCQHLQHAAIPWQLPRTFWKDAENQTLVPNRSAWRKQYDFCLPPSCPHFAGEASSF